jgi:hypothetical protein
MRLQHKPNSIQLLQLPLRQPWLLLLLLPLLLLWIAMHHLSRPPTVSSSRLSCSSVLLAQLCHPVSQLWCIKHALRHKGAAMLLLPALQSCKHEHECNISFLLCILAAAAAALAQAIIAAAAAAA